MLKITPSFHEVPLDEKIWASFHSLLILAHRRAQAWLGIVVIVSTLLFEVLTEVYTPQVIEAGPLSDRV